MPLNNNVLIIGPNVGMGGVERASATLANEFASFGIDTHYISLISDERFYELNSAIHYIEPVDKRNTLSLEIVYTLKYIRKNVLKVSPDAILVFTKFYAALANLALIGTSYGIYVSERSSPLYKWPKKIELFSRVSFSLRKPRGVISQTSLASKYHQKYYGNTKYAIIPNPLREVSLFSGFNREEIILAVGRFKDSTKGFDLLVKAFNQVKNEEWKLVFAGGNALEGQYLLELANEDKKDRIIFLGQVKDIDKEYARAGIFVIPSRCEGFPNALCEAMAAGCPVISFDFISGPREIISNEENGIIVPAEDIDALGEKIDELILNKDKRNRLAKNALSIREDLASSKLAKQFLDFMLY